MKVNTLKIMFLPIKIHKVDEHLLRGSAVFSPVKMIKLKKQDVTQVIDLRNETRVSSRILKLMEKVYCKCTGIKYNNIPLFISSKSVPNQDVFEKINSEIINNNGKTYLHCAYGIHRTNMSVAMYEKSTGRDEGKIVEDFIKNYHENFNSKGNKSDANEKAFELFLKKFFPKFI